MWIFEWAVVVTSMDRKIGSSTFYTWGLKSIHNIHTCFPIIASNVSLAVYLRLCIVK